MKPGTHPSPLAQTLLTLALILVFLAVPSGSAAQLPLPKPSADALRSSLPQQLRLTFVTGGDDLRGGNDNLDVHLVLRDKSMLSFLNVNGGRAWSNNSRNVVEYPLKPEYGVTDIVAIRLEFHGSGGVGGDNWNLDRFTAELVRAGAATTLIDRAGNPFARFTGDNRVVQVRTSGSGPVEVAPIRTEFDPTVHGFRFANMFKIPLRMFDLTWPGLCGGMVYSALDHFYTRTPIPAQPFMPARGHPLFAYLWDRQMQSIKSNLDRWIELFFNPGGARNREFFSWGLQKGSGTLGQLRRNLQAGRPVVLGLQDAQEQGRYKGSGDPWPTMGSHQVVAIGLELGRYYGNLSEFAEDVRIHVYDPNYPRRTRTLRPDTRAATYYYEDEGPNTHNRWRAYFVDPNYRVLTPNLPVAFAPENELWAIFWTGGDDLRGGNDNVHLVLLLRGGRTVRFDNVNDRHRWIDNSVADVARALPDWLRPGEVEGVRLETTFGGGIGGDNWDLNRLEVHFRFGKSSEWIQAFYREDKPLVRFTGERKTAEFRFTLPPPPR